MPKLLKNKLSKMKNLPKIKRKKMRKRRQKPRKWRTKSSTRGKMLSLKDKLLRLILKPQSKL